MLIYRTQREAVSPPEELQLLGHMNDSLDTLIRLGQIEAAVIDVLWPDSDHCDSLSTLLRHATIEAARLWRGRPGQIPFSKLPAWRLPDHVELTVPEGYAYYGLYPEMYAEAAARFRAAVLPERVCVIGIRSIGTSLSAAVAARLEELGSDVRSYTVRPRGHPFDRCLRLTVEFERELLSKPGEHFAIVDEGPGLSGSSLTCVAGKLSDLGVPDERISLFPSWAPAAENLRSDTARRRWVRHRKYSVPFEEVFPLDDAVDLSAGKWRRFFCGTDECRWPAVQPQHERRKYACGERLRKFAGLGRLGARKLERAALLHDAGIGTRPVRLEGGFLETEIADGRPLTAGEASPEFLDAAARYLRLLASDCPGGRGASFDDLAQMVEVNTAGAVSASALARFRVPVDDAAPISIDGRMFPHEWLRTKSGYIKTDALDHHDDHFLPGCQPIAWDVAGMSVEFGLTAEATAYIAKRCHGTEALDFYTIAYLAFRIGYVTVAAEATTGTPDALRFERLASYYRGLMEAARNSL